MYLVRNEDGKLMLFYHYPVRDLNENPVGLPEELKFLKPLQPKGGYWTVHSVYSYVCYEDILCSSCMMLPKEWYPEITWESEPVEVDLVIPKKKKVSVKKTCNDCKFFRESPRCMTGEPCDEWTKRKTRKK